MNNPKNGLTMQKYMNFISIKILQFLRQEKRLKRKRMLHSGLARTLHLQFPVMREKKNHIKSSSFANISSELAFADNI